MYGITDPIQVVQFAVDVCEVLGNGENRVAHKMLIETAAQETWCGKLSDRHNYKLGVGLNQIDKIAFKDVKARTRQHNVEKVEQAFGIDIEEVEYRELAHSPLLSMVFARLFYILEPEPIPDTLEGRAEYWKEHYNTDDGAGTTEKYLNSARRYALPLYKQYSF